MAKPGVFEQLAAYTPQERPAAVVHALRQLSKRTGRDLILIARLAHEAHEGGYWSKTKRSDGSPYMSEEEFFAEVMDVASWRTAMKRLALGRALAALPEGEREGMAERLGDLGAAKATILIPALEHGTPDELDRWVQVASVTSPDDLQGMVSDALNRRRAQGGEDGDRVARWLMNLMPSVEAKETCETFLKLGKKVVDSDSAIAVLLAAMQECIAEWSGRT